jgi:hypothetical protein
VIHKPHHDTTMSTTETSAHTSHTTGYRSLRGTRPYSPFISQFYIYRFDVPYLDMNPFSLCSTLINTNSDCGDSYKLHSAFFCFASMDTSPENQLHYTEGLFTVLALLVPRDVAIRRRDGLNLVSSERMLHTEYNRKCSVEKKNTGRGSQGAWCQYEPFGGKPPVVKVL